MFINQQVSFCAKRREYLQQFYRFMNFRMQLFDEVIYTETLHINHLSEKP